jgi:hypothetical protein
MKYRNRYHENTRVIRVTLGDYGLLKELSNKGNCSIAEVLHLVITEQAKREAIVVPPAQIPMPVFSITGKPAISVRPKGGIIRE